MAADVYLPIRVWLTSLKLVRPRLEKEDIKTFRPPDKPGLLLIRYLPNYESNGKTRVTDYDTLTRRKKKGLLTFPPLSRDQEDEGMVVLREHHPHAPQPDSLCDYCKLPRFADEGQWRSYMRFRVELLFPPHRRSPEKLPFGSMHPRCAAFVRDWYNPFRKELDQLLVQQVLRKGTPEQNTEEQEQVRATWREKYKELEKELVKKGATPEELNMFRQHVRSLTPKPKKSRTPKKGA